MGDRNLGFAKALVNEMPCTLAALEAGVLSEWRAGATYRSTAPPIAGGLRILTRDVHLVTVNRAA